MVKKKATGNDGCLRIFITGVLTAILFVILLIVLDTSILLTLVVSLVIAVLITSLILGRPPIGVMIRNGIITLILFVLFSAGGGFLLKLLEPLPTDTDTFTEEDTTVVETRVEETDTVVLYTSNRHWRDNYGNSFNGSLSVRERDFVRLQDHLRSYTPLGGPNFWGDLYDYIDRTDTPSLDLVMDAFRKINSEKQLNQMEFAEMVVSCIQDIPYSFVFQEECLDPEYYEDSIKRTLEKCPECCIGNVMYGIQNPVSFIQNLKGDCDTRTVIIYSILKDFGYDVAILNSDFYRHSILGLNIPASGLYKVHNGKKYVLWETTAKYFEIGYLSPNFSDVSHWGVVLTSK